MTDADFPRVLNGPAPGYAEDALRGLLGALPIPTESEPALSLFDARRGRNRTGDAFERAPTAASGALEEADELLDSDLSEEGVKESATFAGVSGLEGQVGAALSEGFSWEHKQEEEEEEEQEVRRVWSDETLGGKIYCYAGFLGVEAYIWDFLQSLFRGRVLELRSELWGTGVQCCIRPIPWERETKPTDDEVFTSSAHGLMPERVSMRGCVVPHGMS